MVDIATLQREIKVALSVTGSFFKKVPFRLNR